MSTTSARFDIEAMVGLASFVAKAREGEATYSCTYEQSWGEVLSNHVQWRCKLCLDHTGEFADIAVGDPWYRPIQEGEMGSSLIVARTDVGKRYVETSDQGRSPYRLRASILNCCQSLNPTCFGLGGRSGAECSALV